MFVNNMILIRPNKLVITRVSLRTRWHPVIQEAGLRRRPTDLWLPNQIDGMTVQVYHRNMRRECRQSVLCTTSFVIGHTNKSVFWSAEHEARFHVHCGRKSKYKSSDHRQLTAAKSMTCYGSAAGDLSARPAAASRLITNRPSTPRQRRD